LLGRHLHADRSNPNIRVKDLQKLLAHSDMKIVTGQGSTGIDVADSFTWVSKHRLTLDANQSINIAVPIVVEGNGGVTLITNDGGSGGDYAFAAPGSLAFWDTTSSLIINGQSFTLVKDIATLAGDIAVNASGNYALANSYDASADGAYAKAPVQTALQGTFEGLGATIQNLTIASATQRQTLGLFSTLDFGGTIRDINLSNANVSGSGTTCQCQDEIAGTLVGSNGGTVTAATASGSVSEAPGRTAVGGLAGVTSGTITRSSFSGNLSAGTRGSSVGGITGELFEGTILQSMANVNIGGGYGTGGLVGYLLDGTITLSRASGTVSGTQAGGLVGIGDSESGATIQQSFASATVSAADDGGGLIAAASRLNIAQSYSTGAVGGRRNKGNHIGGFMGYNLAATISQTYAAGAVTAGKHVPCAGGFVSYDASGVYASAYWDITSTGQKFSGCNANVDGITGLTDAQFKSALPAGFDPSVWGQSAAINNGWPYLLANPPPQ
jgi:hypothetical protein